MDALATDAGRSFVAAVTTLLVAIFLGLRSRALGTDEPGRQIRNHLTEFSKAWLLLSIYYAVRAGLQRIDFPVEIESSPYRPAWEQYLYHLFVMALSSTTNVLLLRAIVMIEHSEQTGDAARPAKPQWLASGTSLRVVDFSSERGVYLMGLLALGLILTPLLEGVDYSSWWVGAAYLANLSVASALFIRLARVYLFGLRSRVLGWASFFYAISQLFYVAAQSDWVRPKFQVVLILLKLFLGGALLILAKSLVPTSQSDDEHRIRDVGDRMEGLTKARLLAQRLAFGLTIMLIGGSLIRLVRGPIAAVSRQGSWYILLGVVLGLVALSMALVAAQLLAYLVLYRLAFGVDWDWHRQNSLRGLLELKRREKLGTHLTSLVLSRPNRGPSVASRCEVILVHGMFSSGPKAWGLLPLLLLRDTRISRVHVLSYKHLPWSGAADLASVESELTDEIAVVSREAQCDTVVIGHSFGGLLTMRALRKLFSDKQRQPSERPHHAIILAAPLAGSPSALLGWPWAWPRRVQWNSVWARDTIQEFSNTFPPPGYVVGEAEARPTFSFVTAARDNVAGSHALLLNIPGQRIEVSGWHSTVSAVFHRESKHAGAVFAELEPSSREARLAHILAAQFVGKNEPTLVVTFELEADGDLSHAVAQEPEIEGWGKPIVPARLSKNPTGKQTLEVFLRSRYDELSRNPIAIAAGNAPSPQWASLWNTLREKFMIASAETGLVRVDWNQESTLYLKRTHSAGFLVVMKERLHRIRTNT